MPGTEATPDHRHPRRQPRLHGGGGVVSGYRRLEPLSVLAFRAISDSVWCEAFCRQSTAATGGRFQLLSVLLCGAIRAVGASTDRFKLCGRILICGVLSYYIVCHGPVNRRKEPAIQDRFKLLRILAFRATSYRIWRGEFPGKPIENGRFQLLSVLLCGVIRAEGAVDDWLKLCCILTCGVVCDYIRQDVIDREDPEIDLLRNLPEGVLCTILSKLPLDEVVRTSVLSRKWRKLWTVCPKLSFNGNTMCGKNNYPERLHVLMFHRNVNKVLAQCRGKLVEELAVKIDMNWRLVKHLNDWVSFAVSSRTKALVFDLAPEEDRQPTSRNDRYRFPFELLDKDSIRCLQKIHFTYVDFQPPMQFSGFPNLRKLDLKLVNASGEYISHMLSNCCNLEWLCIVRCHISGELEVNSPLPHLLYLKIASCKSNTNIAFHAVNLATFEYRGMAVPIDLGKSSELECGNICYSGDTLEHTITALAEVRNVRRLTLSASCKQPEIPCLMRYRYKFSRMIYLQLRLVCVKEFDTLSLVSFLRSAPFVENLELHFSCTDYVHLVQESIPIRKLQESLFNNMKSMYITGFKAYNDQVEFILHMLENAPTLEVLTLDHLEKYPLEGHEKEARSVVNFIHTTARWYFEGMIPPKCTLLLL